MTRLHFFFAEGSADVLFDNGKGHAFRTAVSWLTDAVLVSNPFNDLTPPAVRDKLQVGTAGCLAMGNFTGNGIQILTLHAILLTVHEKFQILQMRTRFLSARKESARCWLKSSLTFRNPALVTKKLVHVTQMDHRLWNECVKRFCSLPSRL